MNDPRFQSVHLAALPRREDFRRARSRLEAACGDCTIAGSLRLADPEPPADAVTMNPDAVYVAKQAAEVGSLVCYLIDNGRVHTLKVGLNSVGRLPDNNVVIDDASVSRRHCAILVHSDLTCELHDTASKNGTTLNGSRIPGPTRLKHGDELVLCDRRLKFCRTANLPASMPPPDPRKPPSTDHTMLGT